MKVKKKIHPAWKDIRTLSVSFSNRLGKYQYIYTSKKGKISLIKLTGAFYSSTKWEIYCLAGILFDDIERFKTKKEAEERIKKLLE